MIHIIIKSGLSAYVVIMGLWIEKWLCLKGCDGFLLVHTN